eukprot:515441_1
MGDSVGDGASLASLGSVAADGSLGASADLDNAAELNLSLVSGDAVKDEAALDVVQKAVLLVGALDGEDILETGGVGDVGADLVVNLDEAPHHDLNDLAAGQSVLQ